MIDVNSSISGKCSKTGFSSKVNSLVFFVIKRSTYLSRSCISFSISLSSTVTGLSTGFGHIFSTYSETDSIFGASYLSSGSLSEVAMGCVCFFWVLKNILP